MPEAWYRLPVFYFSNVSELRGPDDPVWCPAASQELDYELEVCALVDTPAIDLAPERAEEAIGGYMVFNDWSARDLQRDETTVRLGPAKGKDFATTIGPWLVTPDELADARDGNAYDLAMTATVNGTETSRGSWANDPARFRGDARAGVGRRPPSPRRPDRERHRRFRLPARDQGRDAGAVAGARRRGRPVGGAAGEPAVAGGGATRMTMRSSELTIHTGSRRGLFDITADCEQFVAGAGDGLLTVFVPHATAGIVIMELGSGTDEDLLATLERLLPRDDRWRHRHGSPGHGADHVLPLLVPPSITVPVRDGRLGLGTWQSIAVLDTNADNATRSVVLTLLEG